MVMHREELQLEMLRLQVEHQHIVSSYTVVTAILFSSLVSIATSYMGIYAFSGNFAWLLTVFLAILGLAPAILLTWDKYNQKAKNINEEIRKLRQRFLL